MQSEMPPLPRFEITRIKVQGLTQEKKASGKKPQALLLLALDNVLFKRWKSIKFNSTVASCVSAR